MIGPSSEEPETTPVVKEQRPRYGRIRALGRGLAR
jgi:hypothetical protein